MGSGGLQKVIQCYWSDNRAIHSQILKLMLGWFYILAYNGLERACKWVKCMKIKPNRCKIKSIESLRQHVWFKGFIRSYYADLIIDIGNILDLCSLLELSVLFVHILQFDFVIYSILYTYGWCSLLGNMFFNFRRSVKDTRLKIVLKSSMLAFAIDIH